MIEILHAQFWTHSFESSGGYTASVTEFSDGAEDYWGRIDITNRQMTDGTSIATGASSVSGQGGNWVFGASDIDGAGVTLPVNIIFDDISISNKSKIIFHIKIAEDDDGANEDWDASDYVRCYYDIDNSGVWSNLLWIENDGSGTNAQPGIDTDFDGNNNGTFVTDTFLVFEKYIATTGSLIDIKIVWNLNAGDEDLYIDDLALYDGVTISGNSGFRMMSSPVAGQIYSDLLSELWTQGMTGADETSGTANVWTLDVANQSWVALSNLSTDTQVSGEGFLVYVFENADGLNGDSDLPVTLSVSGTENSASATLGSIADGNWALAGNPYASTIDWDLVTKTNLSATVSVWDDASSAYISWNGTTGSLTDGLIAPYQGFWVQASNGTGSITIETGDKSSTAGTFYRTTQNENTGSFSFTVSSDTYIDHSYVSFMETGELGMDNADGYKLLPISVSERIVALSYADGNGLDINNLPFEGEGSIEIPFDVMKLTVDEEYNFVTNEEAVSLNWDLSNLPESILNMMLTNNQTGEVTDLLIQNELSFYTQAKGSFLSYGNETVNTYPELGESQFTLAIEYTALSTDKSTLPTEFALHPVYPNPFNPSAIISFDIPSVETQPRHSAGKHVTSLQVFNIKGQLVETLVNERIKPGRYKIQWNPMNLSSGVYMVKLESGSKTFTKKISYIK
ncbi:MAG: T9SS type A sorting domain-containing protein [Candidatus Marinimicrobia bacterium]|nr:T9SS type A sorting domain-containing protein [Candidatus Neomarinimicrobiota bacterium]MBT4145048.1 T9SS type A sorting domain-containing protein [Candidatus Neomarinimicrobiota bacterium]